MLLSENWKVKKELNKHKNIFKNEEVLEKI